MVRPQPSGWGIQVTAFIGRREFITLLAGATAAWPRAARAQQLNQVRHIGVFLGLAASADDPGAGEILRPFKAAMQDAGWIDGKNIRLDYRFGGGDIAKINAAAAELVALAPELIYATGLPPVQALRQRTPTIPIVFSLVADPVGVGLIESLSHPGGNVTGFIVWDLSIGGKWMQLLQQIAPDVRRIGIMYNPDTAPYARPLIASARATAATGVIVFECLTRDDNEIAAAASSLGNEPHGGLLIIPEPFTNAHRDQIIAQTIRFKLPTLNPVFGAANRGALISYTYAFDLMMRQPVTYVDRILRGESPRSLPVQAPTKYVLSINLKVAKALGLSVPPTLLALADEVIE
jgi:putative ABC transport system substrate-binding protein